MLDRGEVTSMADIARLGRVSRAKVTQVMDLLLLAPDLISDSFPVRQEPSVAHNEIAQRAPPPGWGMRLRKWRARSLRWLTTGRVLGEVPEGLREDDMGTSVVRRAPFSVGPRARCADHRSWRPR